MKFWLAITIGLSYKKHREYPWKFKDGQLRTFQRRVKAWRLEKVSKELEALAISGHNTEEGHNEQSKILT